MNNENRYLKSNIVLIISNIIIPLIIGAFIYVISRETYIYRFLRYMGMKEINVDIKIPSIIRNYGCDFLWAYSLSFSLFLAIGMKVRSIPKIIPVEILFCLILEFLQLLSFFKSTFDPVDCLVELSAVAIANAIIILIHKRGRKDYEKKS